MCSVSRFSFHFFSQHEHDVWISRWMRCTERLVDDEEGFRFLCDRVNTLEHPSFIASLQHRMTVQNFTWKKSIPEKIAITPVSKLFDKNYKFQFFYLHSKCSHAETAILICTLHIIEKTFTFSSLFSCENTKKLYERREFTTMPRNPAVNLAQSTKELSAVKQDTKTNNFQFSDRFYPSSFHIIIVYSPSLPSLLSVFWSFEILCIFMYTKFLD